MYAVVRAVTVRYMTSTAARPTWLDRVRLHKPPTWAVDVALGVVALLTGLASTSGLKVNDVVYEPRNAFAYTLIALATLPFMLRSRYPIGVLVLTSTAVVVLSASEYNEGALPVWLLLGAATVGNRNELRRVVGVAAYMFVLMVLLLASQHDRNFSVWTFLVQLALFPTAFTVGTSIRSRRLRLEALEQRTEALEATRAEEAKRAVSDERLHIAQELHDVLAHTLSVIAVQAGTGAHVIDQNPAEAKRALDNIAETSRSSLAELRQLLGVLRSDDDTKTYVPAPRLADLDRLAGEVTAAGVPVEMTIEGSPGELTPGVELTAYRIVQEALTNVMKHAGPARAQVRLSFTSGALEIDVTDDGRGLAARNGNSHGHGLIGMQERVAMYGGTLQAAGAPGGGFRVSATLPCCEATS
jgi:signal transduction histidine kinase